MYQLSVIPMEALQHRKENKEIIYNRKIKNNDILEPFQNTCLDAVLRSKEGTVDFHFITALGHLRENIITQER